MEMVLFTIVAVILYVVSDWILNQIEIRQGARLENRSLVFFVIIGTLSFISFYAIQTLYIKSDNTTATNNQLEQVAPVTSKDNK
ncbi:MAG: hypothetical protein OEZ38_08315 [Gammaproteobacteria bacterium]|nr:hypothetical protein [Gammaproteobacteria bacterium]